MNKFFIKAGGLRPFPVLLLILMGVLVVYWQVHNFAFVGFDDSEYVVDNPAVNNGLSWASFKWAFTAFYAANWHPLAWLSHMLDVTLFGLKSGCHHLSSLVWHLANTVLLFFLLHYCWRGAVWRSAIVTLLFAWHPLRVESVAWVAERKDLLCAFFWLLTLIFYTYYANKANWQRYLLTLTSAALALLAKPMAVTLPFLLLVLDYWPLQRYVRLSVKRLVLEKVPFFLLIILSAVLTFMAQRQAGAMSSAIDLGIFPRLVNTIVAYCEYVKLLFWPHDLAVLYRYRIDYSWLRVGLSLLFFFGSFGWVFYERKRSPFLLVGWCWFVGTLVPVIGLVQVGGQAWADRYTYFPAIGLWFALVWLGAEYCPAKWRPRVAAMAVLLSCFYMVLSWHQVRYWQNSMTLFQRAVAVDQDNPVAYDLLGQAMASAERWSEANRAFQRALKLNPRFGQSLVNWGNALHGQGRNREAESVYRQAMQPETKEIGAFVALAALFKQEERLDDAEKILRQALQFAPDNSAANYNLGTVLLSKGLVQASISPLKQAMRVRPYHVKTRINLAIALAQSGHFDTALEQFRYVLKLDPGNKQALYNLQQLQRLQKRVIMPGAGG